MKLEGHPQKAAILKALERRRLGRIDAFFENFLTELAVTGACHCMGAWLLLLRKFSQSLP